MQTSQQRVLILDDEHFLPAASAAAVQSKPAAPPMPANQMSASPSAQMTAAQKAAAAVAQMEVEAEEARLKAASASQQGVQSAQGTESIAEQSSSSVADASLELEDAGGIDNICSNDVLEWEAEQVSRQLQAHTSRGLAEPEDLLDRKIQIELKMQLLITEIQSGVLELPAYVERLKQQIERDKALALKLKRGNRKEDALVVMNRIKIMKAEIESADDGGSTED